MKKSVLVIGTFLALSLCLAGVFAVDVVQNIYGVVVPDYSVYINEIEANPADGGEWVEIYNDEDFSVDVSGWEVWEGISTEKIIGSIDEGTTIDAKGFYVYELSSDKLNNGGDYVILKNQYGMEIDRSPELEDQERDSRTQSRVPDGTGDFVFQESTKGYTNIPTVISDMSVTTSYEDDCAIESLGFTLGATVTGNGISEVIFSVFNGTDWINFTASSVGDFYSVEVPAFTFEDADLSWVVFATNCYGDVKRSDVESLDLNSMTELVVDPELPDGENGWYVSEPEFTLTNPDATTISYRWDGEHFVYSDSFGLEGAPNGGNETGGIIELRYWSDVCGGEEELSWEGNFDFFAPEIEDISPADEEVVVGEFRPTIRIELDDKYQSNSGINDDSVRIVLDGVEVDPVVDVDGMDAVVTFVPVSDLEIGEHEVEFYCKDLAGHETETDWGFFVAGATPINLQVHLPVNGLYDSRRIPFNVTTDFEVSEISYINYADRSPRWRRLCRNCDSYGNDRVKTINVNEGLNDLLFRATDEDGNFEEVAVDDLTVDSKDPRIIRTEPRRGFGNGEFTVDIREDNPVDLVLRVDNGELFREFDADLNDCYEDRSKTKCEVSVDLSEFEGQEVSYTFELVDIVGGSDVSRAREIEIDTVAPEVVDWNYELDGRRIEFEFEITEDNFDELGYIDWEDRNPRWRRLCSRLREGVCEKRVSFRRGEHDLDISVWDEAGNSAVVVEGLIFTAE